MNYKKIVRSRKLRLKILQLLSFIPDKTMLKLQYRIKMGRKLDLKNPKRFTEKLQWYKLYYKNPLMIQCVDKYDVREYVAQKGLEKILIPCYGVYNSIEEINWDQLPKQFVMKDTLGGGGCSVIIVKNKDKVDGDAILKEADQWIKTNSSKKGQGREWPYYSGKKHRIIIEKFIDSNENDGGLIDYKFFCYDGNVEFLYVLADRQLGNGVGLGIFDAEFSQLDVQRDDERTLERKIDKPLLFNEMKKVAGCLAESFPEARVDLYYTNNQILFGEITFYDGSGYMRFKPDEFDYKAGSKLNLKKYN